MGKPPIWLVPLLFTSVGCRPEPPAPPAAPPDLTELAIQFVDRLAAGEWAQAAEPFDADMLRVMPPDVLRSNWEQLVAQVGPFIEHTGTRQVIDGDITAVFVVCRFEKAALDLRVVFDAEHRIGGFWVSPADRSGEYAPPDYIDPTKYTEREVTVGEGEWALPGTLTVPVGAGPHPAVVLVHGSGPQDRDETIGPNKPFRDLAGGLGSRGIAVLRYVKRTKQHNAAMAAAKVELTVKEETVDDALLAVELLRATEGIDPARIMVLGHSLGGMLVPRIGVRDAGIAGFIIAAGTTRDLAVVTIDQLDYIASLHPDLPADERAQLDALRAQAVRAADPALSPDTPADELPLGVSARYWLDLRAPSPAELVRELNRPILVLQGGRDYQVTEVDFAGWQQALAGRDDATFHFYADLNHLFAPGEGKATPEEYERPNHVAVRVIDDIAAWIAAL